MNIIIVILALLLVALVFTSSHAVRQWEEWRSLAGRNKQASEDAVAALAEARDAICQLKAQNQTAAQTVLDLAAARNVAWPKPAKRVPPHEVKRAFAVDNDAPLWLAFNQELDDYLQDQVDQMTLPPAPGFTEESRLHLAGGVEHLRLFQKRLIDLHAAAHKVDGDLEGEAPEKRSAA